MAFGLPRALARWSYTHALSARASTCTVCVHISNDTVSASMCACAYNVHARRIYILYVQVLGVGNYIVRWWWLWEAFIEQWINHRADDNDDLPY